MPTLNEAADASMTASPSAVLTGVTSSAPRRRNSKRQRRRRRARLWCDRTLAVDSLSAAKREAIGPRLYAIFCDSYGELDYDTVTDEIIFRAGGSLYLIRDVTGAIVGFGTIAIDDVEIDGRDYGVIQGGVYLRRDVRGGGAVFVRRGAVALLRAKLQRPRRPLYGVFEFLTPISYRLGCRVFPRCYPSRHADTPPTLAAVLSATLDRRGLQRPGAHPFVIQYPDPASHQRPERITESPSKQADPDVRYYIEQNPHFLEGHILCGIVPLNARELLTAIYRCARAILKRS